MNGITGEVWEKMKDGRRIREVGGIRTAFRDIDRGSLVWDKWEGGSPHPGMRLVTAREMFELEWELVAKKEEKEIETEKWMRVCSAGVIEEGLHYEPFRDAAIVYSPSAVMDNKDFLRWVGTIPGGGYDWPSNQWYVWISKNGNWDESYDPKSFTKKIFAEYAEMRVEK